MSRRGQIQMTDQEIQEFLGGVHTLQVATINADGTPHLVAMWYTMIAGDVAFWTYAKSQKVVNLLRDPRLTCMVETGKTYDQLRGVQLRGRAEVSDDRVLVQRIGEDLMVRYQGAPDPLDETMRAAATAMGAKRAAVVLKAEQVVSWDHGKLGGGY